MHFDDRPSSGGRFFEIAEALCRAVGNAIRPGFIDAVLAMIVVRRIQRVRGILLALEARFLSGTLRRHAGRVVRAEKTGERAVRPVVAARLPRSFSWLCPLVPSTAATCALHFRIILAEPGMQALLAGCPQAVRTVGPLCRMLGIARDDYVPAAELEAERVERVARAERVRTARALRVKEAAAVVDPREAHYASSGVPRRFWFRVPGL
jgi:hypothetical protein